MHHIGTHHLFEMTATTSQMLRSTTERDHNSRIKTVGTTSRFANQPTDLPEYSIFPGEKQHDVLELPVLLLRASQTQLGIRLPRRGSWPMRDQEPAGQLARHRLRRSSPVRSRESRMEFRNDHHKSPQHWTERPTSIAGKPDRLRCQAFSLLLSAPSRGIATIN